MRVALKMDECIASAPGAAALEEIFEPQTLGHESPVWAVGGLVIEQRDLAHGSLARNLGRSP